MPNRRQEFALTNPLSRADDDILRFRKARRHPTGVTIQSILAVDR
jgi:hypothetical protein